LSRANPHETRKLGLLRKQKFRPLTLALSLKGEGIWLSIKKLQDNNKWSGSIRQAARRTRRGGSIGLVPVEGAT